MATKTTENKTAETVENIRARDPMQEFVNVYLPRATGKEENFVFVALNGKGYSVMRGVTVRLPKPVADILAESERQKERQAAFIQAQREKSERAGARPY